MTAAVRSTAALAGTWMLALAAGVASHVEPPETQQQPAFRAGVSGVAVDVSVRDRSRRPITNLQASDFEVLDNGVPQSVDSVSYGKLPIDVTVALDVSYSVTGMLLEQLRRGVVQLMRDLTRQDRLKLILFNMRVNRTVDFTADVEVVERAIRGATAGGSTALLDAISVALVSASAPDRRQLIVFFTDGSDNTSVTAPAALAPVAQRTRATVTFVMPAPAAIGDEWQRDDDQVNQRKPAGTATRPGPVAVGARRRDRRLRAARRRIHGSFRGLPPRAQRLPIGVRPLLHRARRGPRRVPRNRRQGETRGCDRPGPARILALITSRLPPSQKSGGTPRGPAGSSGSVAGCECRSRPAAWPDSPRRLAASCRPSDS